MSQLKEFAMLPITAGSTTPIGTAFTFEPKSLKVIAAAEGVTSVGTDRNDDVDQTFANLKCTIVNGAPIYTADKFNSVNLTKLIGKFTFNGTSISFTPSVNTLTEATVLIIEALGEEST